MSSPRFNLIAQVVVTAKSEEEAAPVVQELRDMLPDASISPMREQESLNDAIEFYLSAVVNEAQKEQLLNTLNNDWDEDDGLYWAYGFNTKMWNPQVYYLQLDFTKLKQQ